MGLSAKDSRIYLMDHDCPERLDGTVPTGLLYSFWEQVTRIEVTPAVYQRKYLHDKSFGANDVCSGGKSWDGSITTKIGSGSNPFTLTAGDIVWLRVYPVGPACHHPIQGYAVIDSDPIICNLENGDPVEHNYRYSSKGLWTGLPARTWGGYECACGGSDSAITGASQSSFAPAAARPLGIPVDDPEGGTVAHATEVPVAGPRIPTHLPVTVYQWNGTVWLPSYDECREGFVPGAAPDAQAKPGTFVGEMLFVPCVAQ